MGTSDFKAADFYVNCVCLGLNRAARATSRRYDAVLRPLGITSGQFSILSALKPDQLVPIGALAELLGMDRTTLNRNLKPLEAARLVETLRLSRDKRVRNLRLTDQGRERRTDAVPLWARAQADSDRRLGAAGWADLRPTLDALV